MSKRHNHGGKTKHLAASTGFKREKNQSGDPIINWSEPMWTFQFNTVSISK